MIRARLWIPWAVVVVVVVAALVYAQSATGQRLMKSLGLVHDDQHYTALSFTDVRALPYSVPQRSRQTMSLSIENHRGETLLYLVQASQTGSRNVIAEAKTIIPDGATRSVEVRTPVRCARGAKQVRVTFTLSPSGESINHTMLCQAAE